MPLKQLLFLSLPFLTYRSLISRSQRSHFHTNSSHLLHTFRLLLQLLLNGYILSLLLFFTQTQHPQSMATDLSLSLLLLLSLISIATTLSHTSHPATLSRQQSNNNGVVLELWCVAKNNAEDLALQSALDWACGSGGANCGPIQQGGPCYDPTDIQRTASYAFNDYYLKNGLSDDSCNFENTAALTSLNPSHNNCKFPSSLTVKNGNSTTTIGVEPVTASSDISGGYCVESRRVIMVLIFIHILIPITVII